MGKTRSLMLNVTHTIETTTTFSLKSLFVYKNKSNTCCSQNITNFSKNALLSTITCCGFIAFTGPTLIVLSLYFYLFNNKNPSKQCNMLARFSPNHPQIKQTSLSTTDESLILFPAGVADLPDGTGVL